MGIRLIAATCLATVLSLAAPASSAQKKPDKKKEAEELLARVQAATDIRAPGSAPFRLRARVRLEGLDGGPYNGTYTLVWASPQMWREEVVLGEYKEARVFRNETLWVAREADFIPYHVDRLRRILDFPASLKLGTREKVKRVSDPDKKRPFKCIELGSSGVEVEMCFALEPERLVKQTVKAFGTSTLEISDDYLSLGNKRFPRRMTYFDGGQRAIELTVEEFSEETQVSESIFPPTQNARPWKWCRDFKRASSGPRVSDWLAPPTFQATDFSWRITFFAVVGTDGKARDIRVIQNDRPDLQEHALRAAAGAKFIPAQCGDHPIESEAVLEFGLSRRVMTHFTLLGPRLQ